MPLQRYDICHDSFDINVSLSKKVSPCGEWVKADDALAEVEKLKKMIEKMKCCVNCKHVDDHFCNDACEKCVNYSAWELLV